MADKMKRILTQAFVATVNYYFLTFFIGLFFVVWTVFGGALNMWVALSVALATLIASIGYQLTRAKYSWQSIGETIVGNTSKSDILAQKKIFRVSRVPLFLLIQVTLIVNGNLQDGLGEEKKFTAGNVLSFAVIFWCTYQGLQSFFRKPDHLPSMLIAAVLLFLAISFKSSQNAPETGVLMYYVYLVLAICWIAAGLFYRSQRVQPIPRKT